jgi:3-oxoacyl-[acyl-carrier-protein] synthase-1
LNPEDIDYINLHGTATQTNDAAESKAIRAVFGNNTPCSSTKGATGHTLGAAGGIEAVICALALTHGLLPAGLNTSEVDPGLGLNYLLKNKQQSITHALSNSFGFGGTNCSLVFGRTNQS